MASLLCLFPAYQTLQLAADSRQLLFTNEHAIKISHQTMSRCIEDAFRLAGDNAGILLYSEDMQATIRQALVRTSERSLTSS
jgi:hypothetical protein